MNPTHSQYLDQLRADLAIFRSTAPPDLTASVPGCPKWDITDLLAHLGGVHRWAVQAIHADTQLPPRTVHAPQGAMLMDWLCEGLSDLIEELGSADPSTPCPTWAGPGNVAWWLRRQAHETVIHRWDLQSAFGPCDSIPTGIACDGVQEWLELFAPFVTNEGSATPTIHLHATDAPDADSGEWLITAGPTIEWVTGHRKGDLAVRGTASELNLLVWNRIPPSRLETHGSLDALSRLRR
jgi:uncharacterized protein (TIGR03083 family)